MNLKITLLSALTLTFIGFVSPQNSYADYIPQSFIEAVREQKAKTVKAQAPSSSELTSFIKKHNPRLDKNVINKIVVNVNKYSKANKVDPKLVLALMARESSFRSNVVSKSGAIGLGQLKRATAKDMGVSNPFNIVENIKGTVRYISWLMKRTDGDIDMTLAAYNMGPGAVKRTIAAGNSIPEKVSQYVNDIKNFHSTI